ncbi:MAG TPA: sulfotransferase domain-containing protein [Capsulimonadaceae bacterium]|nr:sulfotransferase domain-containing protein [Capsulimonadaceae bacterium]
MITSKKAWRNARRTYLTHFGALRRYVVWSRHRGVTEKDVFLASYPKSGNTWLKFLLCHLLAGEEIDFDRSDMLCPPIGFHEQGRALLPEGGRLIKTHEAFRPEYKKSVYIVRDGRDVAVSYYFHCLRDGSFEGEFADFLPLLLAGQIDGYGTWKQNVLSWLDSPAAPNGGVCIIRYEDCHTCPEETMEKVTGFLGIPASSERIKQALEANTAQKMREKEGTAKDNGQKPRADIPFVRSAKTGDWRNTFTADQHALFLKEAGDVLQRMGYLLD